jgi:hypothetical protein
MTLLGLLNLGVRCFEERSVLNELLLEDCFFIQDETSIICIFISLAPILLELIYFLFI